jgi:glucosamine-6-phosphate deaminase
METSTHPHRERQPVASDSRIDQLAFRRYMRENLTQKIPLKEFSEVDGSAPNPEQVCRDYARKLNSANRQLCLLGIGGNGI